MNILFDATVLEHPHTGIAKSTLCLYKACGKIDRDIKFTGIFQKDIFGGLPDFIKLQKFKTFFKKNWKKKAFSGLSDKLCPDIIHFPCNGDIPGFYPESVVVMTLNDVLPIEMHEYYSEDAKQAYKVKVQSDIDKTDILVTISEYSKKQILKNFQCKKEPVVISCANTVLSPNTEIRHKKDNYFIYVGGYAARKGIDDIVEAFLYLHSRRAITDKIVFVGFKQRFSTKGNKFNRLADEAVSKGILEEKGYVSENELGDLISRAKGLLYPSKYEGFGLPVLEAMHMGCPVVTTRCTSLPEICGDAALYVEPGDMKQIAEAIVSLQDTDMRNALIEKGIARDTLYSWDKSASLFLQLINDKLRRGVKV